MSGLLTACSDPPPTVTPAGLDGFLHLDESPEPQQVVTLSSKLLASATAVVMTDDLSDERALRTARNLRLPLLPDDEAGRAEAERLGADTIKPEAEGTPAEAATRKTSALVTFTSPPSPAIDHLVKVSAAEATTVTGDPRSDADAVATLQSSRNLIAVGGKRYPFEAVHTDARVAGDRFLLLPGQHFVAMYGHPSGPSLGVLGEQGPQACIKRVQQLVKKYEAVAPDVDFQPSFEIITTVATADPGPRKDYSARTPIAELEPLVDAAEKAGIKVILDLQPGRDSMLKQAKFYEPLLRRPHVGLALDPEWKLGPQGKPLQRIGHVTAKQVNEVSDWLATLVRKEVLPQKMFVLHQFQTQMIRDRKKVRIDHPELATVIHVDGQGPTAAKHDTWNMIRKGAPKGVFWGWKNFIDEDEPMLTPRQTWAQVRELPDLITYQ